MQNLRHINIFNFKTEGGFQIDNVPLSYQTFGCKLGVAPIVLVNHALTGNSNVTGETGWWKDIIGDDNVIDTLRYTVLAFNIPGNNYDGFSIDNYKHFVARDIARIFLRGLRELKINQLYAIIGGSLGGGIAWEMAALNPSITMNLIPIASDYKSTDWLIANCLVQEQILINSKEPIHDARLHAMLCYRTPESFRKRFNRVLNEKSGVFNIESWLLHHGKRLQQRFQLSAYKLMNQLLRTVDITHNNKFGIKDIAKIQSDIHLIAVDSDLFFLAKENISFYESIKRNKTNVFYHEINSIHGHDAFLIEYDQLQKILHPIFSEYKMIDTEAVSTCIDKSC